MYRDLEETLTRELGEVADALEVPALPTLPEVRPSRPPWLPLLVAAAVLVVVVGAVVGLTGLGDDRGIQPAPAPSRQPSPTAPPSQSPSPTAAPPSQRTEAEVPPTTAPAVPYVLGTQLFVGGVQVPGEWFYVEGTETGWVAQRRDGTYWWGYGAKPQRLEGQMNQPPAVSPDGRYDARIVDEGGSGTLTGADHRPAGEGFGGVPIDVKDRDGVYTSVAAVTDDGLVVTRGNGTSLLWRPLVDGETVDLAATAPDQLVVDNTAAGLVVVDGSSGYTDPREGEVYLGEISADGEITRLQPLPNHDDLVASEGWLAWVTPGTLGGEVATVPELNVHRLDGSDAGTLAPPEGWAFRAGTWTWEDEDHLVAAVVDDGGQDRMVRCSPMTRDCVLLDKP